MTGNEYQNLSMRTKDSKSTDRMLGKVLNCDMIWLQHQECIREDTNLDLGGLLNGCLGLAGESGEVLDMVKKCIFHEVELDEDHLKKELGDVMWYVAALCEAFGFSLDDIMQMNIEKLKARYPEGFDPKKRITEVLKMCNDPTTLDLAKLRL